MAITAGETPEKKDAKPTADAKANPSSTPQGVTRSAVPYYVAAVFAAGAIAWYLFIFVPAKLDYFVGLKLRALAVASNQVKSRAENLASAFHSAPTSAPDTYFRALVPGIQVSRAGQPSPPGLRLVRSLTGTVAPGTAPDANVVCGKQTLCADVSWDDLVAPAAAVSANEFDDLVITLPSGAVVWQREQTTARIGNLAQVMESTVAERGLFSFNWQPRAGLPKVDPKGLPTAVEVKQVDLGGKSNLLLVQALTLSSDEIQSPSAQSPGSSDAKTTQGDRRDKTLYVAGVVSTTALRNQAMNIPIVWVVALSLPVIVLFLALPFVKLATLTSRERFGFADAVLLLVATVALAGLAATIPLTGTAVDESGDILLSTFAGELQSRIVGEATSVQTLAAHLKEKGMAKAIAEKLEPCLVTVGALPQSRCNFWAAYQSVVTSSQGSETKGPATSNSDVRPASRVDTETKTQPAVSTIPTVDLDVIAWLNERGDQIDKWTTKAQLTGLTSHRVFQHYRDLSSDRLWALPTPSGNLPAAANTPTDTQVPRTPSPESQRFTIEPLLAPTTAELGVAVGFPIEDPTVYEVTKSDAQSDTKPKFLVFNIRPQSLLDTVVPPGLGFAVITPDGKVLFHSQETLSLQENFFEEVGDPATVRARAQSGRVVTWTGDYHGQPHRIHIERLTAIDGCPWRIVTFRDLAPTYGGIIAHEGGTFRLAVLNLLILVMAAFVVWMHARVKGRDVRDLLNVGTITRREWLAGLGVLIVVALLLVRWTYSPSAGRSLDGTYVMFAILPLLAVGCSALARRPGPSRGPLSPALVWSEIVALVLLVAALPAVGFARIAERVQTARADERLLEETQRRVVTRNERLLARVNGPSYRRADGTSLVTDVMRNGFARIDDVDRYAYFSFVPIAVHPTRPATATLPCAPTDQTSETLEQQSLVRFLLDWNPFPSRDVAGRPAVHLQGGDFHLAPLVDRLPVGSGQCLPEVSVHDSSLDAPQAFGPRTLFSVPRLKGVFGFFLLGGTIFGLCWARQRLLVFPSIDAPSLTQVIGCIPYAGSQAIMLIGAPRTNKDSVLLTTLGERCHELALLVHRIRLLETDATPEDAERDIEAAVTPIAAEWERVRKPDDPGARVWIDVSNFETHLVDRKRRKLALELLERLLERGPSSVSRVVVLTTNVDPIAHFEELFEEERKGIYDDAIPEVELSRFALLLTRFHRCYVPIRADQSREDPWWDYDRSQWRTVMAWETNSPALKHVQHELEKRWAHRSAVSLDELSRAIGSRAVALYQLLWTSCTRREKLVLVQLAQEGFVTPQSVEVVAALVAKGLIVLRPAPAIFNYTFRAFLRRIERTEVVREWERGEGHGLWVVAGRLIGSSVLAGGLFFLLTQGYSVEGLLPVLSGTGVFGVPIVRNVMARFSTKGQTATANA